LEGLGPLLVQGIDRRWTGLTRRNLYFVGRRDVLRVTLSGIVIGLASLGLSVQTRTPEDALLAALVWGEYHRIDSSAYPPQVKAELERARQRFVTYRTARRRPVKSSVEEMLYDAMVRYEGLLMAFTSDRKAQALAVRYVDRLRPCYEWEGFHGCPEREASFANEYLAANPNGPFKEYLPLLAAHRWLCTAEAYDYEKRPEDAARSRRESDAAIQTARRSADLLVRAGAEALQARRRCIFSG